MNHRYKQGPKNITLAYAREELRKVGMVITVDTLLHGPFGSGDYTVRFARRPGGGAAQAGDRDSSYETPDLKDALETGLEMAERRATPEKMRYKW